VPGLAMWIRRVGVGAVAMLAFVSLLWTLWALDHRMNLTAVREEALRVLPPGDYLKPLLLGYHHVTADILWLRMIQIIGERKVSAKDYEWLAHGLDVITTLDPHYTYPYQVGGIVLAELAHRVDLSNRLLEKGESANPTYWWLPFHRGFNAFFHLRDYVEASDHMARAARLPGAPAYVPPLAARLYAQAGNPDVALEFLDTMWRQTEDEMVRASLEVRMKEVVIERDIRMLEEAVGRYQARVRRAPRELSELVLAGLLRALPQEPFGGVYRLDPTTGAITSSTHPDRLRVHRSRP